MSRRSCKWRKKLGYPGNEDDPLRKREYGDRNSSVSKKPMLEKGSQCRGSKALLNQTKPGNMRKEIPC